MSIHIGHMVDNPPDIRPGDLPQLVTSGGDHWGPLQTCSFGDLPLPLGATSGGGN